MNGMKIVVRIALILLLLLVLGACESASPQKDIDSRIGAANGGDVWGDSQTPAQTACDRRELPLRKGATWEYESDDGELFWEVTEVEGDSQEATATLVISIAGFSFENVITCTENEGIVWKDFSKQGMSHAFPGLVMESEEVDGVFLPPELTEGSTWETQQQRLFTFNVGEGSTLTEANGSIDMMQSDTVLGTGPFSAAGVTAGGIQIQQVSEILVTVEVMGNPFEQGEIITDTVTLGSGVGIMRHQVESEAASAVWDLTAFTVP